MEEYLEELVIYQKEATDMGKNSMCVPQSVLEVKKRNLQQLADYRERLRKEPQLQWLFFELTDACNMSCLHCGSSCGDHKGTYLPTEDIYRVLDEVDEHYGSENVRIALTGGEPLLHPQFFEIAEYLHEKGFSWGMTSNAALIDEAVAEKLAQTGLGSISISLDGLEEMHDYLRNTKKAFQKTVAAIECMLKNENLTRMIQVTTVVHRKNLSQLSQLYEYLKKLGVRYWRLTNMDPIGRACEMDDLLLNEKEFWELMEYIHEKRYDREAGMEVTFGCAHYLTVPWERMVREFYFMCGAGITVASVTCKGDIFGCLDIERRPELMQGNIKEDSFAEVWENRFNVFRKDRTESSGMCRECEHRVFCRGDALHTWDFDRNEPKLCVGRWENYANEK